MRKTLISLVAAGTLLVGACGDGGGDDEEGAGDSTTSTFPEQTGEFAEFCTALLQGVNSGTGSTAPGLPDVEAPPAIAEDYQLMQDAANRMAELDPNAPDFAQQQQAIQDELGGAERFTQAQSNLQQFVMENCNMPGAEDMEGSETTETTAAE